MSVQGILQMYETLGSSDDWAMHIILRHSREQGFGISGKGKIEMNYYKEAENMWWLEAALICS